MPKRRLAEPGTLSAVPRPSARYAPAGRRAGTDETGMESIQRPCRTERGSVKNGATRRFSGSPATACLPPPMMAAARALPHLILAAFILVVCATGARSELFGGFVGHDACAKCHEEKAASWKKTPHAEAFGHLATQGEEKQDIPGCFKCHVVGFEQDGGYVDRELTPELVDVQCEACHGPGKVHAESEGKPGTITGRPGETTCRECHTPGQDANFDFSNKKMLVHSH